MPESEKKGVPVIVTIIVVLGVLAVLATAGLVALGYFVFKENFGPGHAAAVAADVVELPDPLPEGWQYGVGLSTPAQKIVNLVHRGKGSVHPLVQFTVSATTGFSAKTLASKMKLPSMAGMTFEAQAQGEETIGGQTAYYTRYSCNIINRQSAMEVALVDAPSGHIVQIQTTEDGKKTFDPTLVKPLFDSIKGFKGNMQ